MLLRCIVLFFWLNVWYSKTILRKETEIGTCQWLSPHRTGCNISPQGGENRSTFKVIICSMHCIYPRKGTETCGNPPKPPGNRLQFIPVRGRKPVRTIQLFAILADCNLSPRGGEDAFPLLFTFAKLAISVSPREGTETALPLRQCQNTRRLQFIPVRGRKLTTHGANAQTATLQFIPARGRKRHCSHDNIPILRLQLIPARGQKSTSATGVCQQRRCFSFSYILFYRLGAAPAGIVFVTGSALTPSGTSGFMGRISCR